MTPQKLIVFNNWSSESTVYQLGKNYIDIAEEDDGKIFSVYDWPRITRCYKQRYIPIPIQGLMPY